MKRLLFPLLTIAASPALAQVLNLDGGISLVAEKQVNIVLTDAGMRNDGVFIPDSSTVYMDGASFTALSGSQPTDFFNLRFRGTGTKPNEGIANVLNGLGIEGTTILDADGASNNRTFTLKSSKLATAFVDKIIGGDIIGDLTVERFINSGTAAGEHGKSWQFLATPTTGQTIFEAWQEGGATPAGYGTRISGNGLGFDVYSSTPALKFYNPATNNYTAITNTSDPLQKSSGYMLFVRGDRTVVNYNDPANNTNMRSKGVLFRPVNPPVSVAVGSNLLQSFGNPYASRIDFREVYDISTNIYEMFYAWDPMLNGSYNLGGWQTLSGVVGYIPTAGDATVYYPAGVPAPYIESGQAALVFAGAGGGTVNFNEDVKVGGSALVHRRPLTRDSFPPQKSLLISRLFAANQMADGNILVFQNGLGNEVNMLDAPKLFNAGENLALTRNGEYLSVEARDPVTVTDTLFYHTTNLRASDHEYILEWYPVNMPAGLNAYLIDQFQNSVTPVSLMDSSKIAFMVTVDASSRAANRFMIVFQLKQNEPFQFISADAWANADRTNGIQFTINYETGVQEFVIEKSMDGSQFRPIGNIAPTGNASTTTHSFVDRRANEPTCFYRIKADIQSTAPVYSDILKVTRNQSTRFAAFPNPVRTGKAVTLQGENIPEGEYAVTITNLNGQTIYESRTVFSEKRSAITIQPGIAVSGTYILKLTNRNGEEFTTTLVVL